MIGALVLLGIILVAYLVACALALVDGLEDASYEYENSWVRGFSWAYDLGYRGGAPQRRRDRIARNKERSGI